MRTFHIGGTASRVVEQSYLRSKVKGILRLHNLRIVDKEKELIVLNRNGFVSLNDEQGRELEHHPIPQGSFIYAHDGDEIAKGTIYVRWILILLLS